MIKEIEDWCNIITQKVEMAGKQLAEEVKASSDPRLLEFVRSDHLAVNDKSKVGVLISKRELSTIREEEVRRRFN